MKNLELKTKNEIDLLQSIIQKEIYELQKILKEKEDLLRFFDYDIVLKIKIKNSKKSIEILENWNKILK
jgi:hypothetical protein